MARRAGPLFAALVLLLACAAPRGASALSWRLFAGRCVSRFATPRMAARLQIWIVCARDRGCADPRSRGAHGERCEDPGAPGSSRGPRRRGLECAWSPDGLGPEGGAELRTDRTAGRGNRAVGGMHGRARAFPLGILCEHLLSNLLRRCFSSRLLPFLVICLSFLSLPPSRPHLCRFFFLSFAPLLCSEECIQEYMPEHQWELARQRETDPDLSSVTIDLGVVISSRFGTEGQKASVDLRVLSPSDVELYSEPAVTEANMLTTGTGGRGPWKACFRVSRGRLLRPSVIVRVTHFTVNHASLLGTRFEWQRGGPRAVLGDGDGRGLGGAVGSSPPVETLASASQIDELVEGLQRLDHYILNVTHEQRYLSARTDRHLVTVESTHSRTLFYHVALDVVIIAAAFAQIVGVRLMFKRSRRQGIII